VAAVELAQIAKQILINYFVADDGARIKVIQFELGSVLVQGPFRNTPSRHTLVLQQREKLLHRSTLEDVCLQRVC